MKTFDFLKNLIRILNASAWFLNTNMSSKGKDDENCVSKDVENG